MALVASMARWGLIPQELRLRSFNFVLLLAQESGEACTKVQGQLR